MDLSFWVENGHNISIIHLRGRLIADNINLIKEIWETQVRKNPKTIAINCGDVVTADAKALRTLVNFLNNAVAQGIGFHLLDLNSALKRTLKENGLIDYFQINSKAEFETKYSGKKGSGTAAYSFMA